MKRARFHSSILDAEMLKKKQKFKQIKDTYVIFIYKYDKFKKGLPLYHIDRYVSDTGEAFGDGSHIIYVNGRYKGNDDIGKLMEDFQCKSPENMHFATLADSVSCFKGTGKGRKVMSDEVRKYAKKYAKEYADEKVRKNTINNVKSLMLNMKWTVEQALDALSITGNERTQIIGKLQK